MQSLFFMHNISFIFGGQDLANSSRSKWFLEKSDAMFISNTIGIIIFFSFVMQNKITSIYDSTYLYLLTTLFAKYTWTTLRDFYTNLKIYLHITFVVSEWKKSDSFNCIGLVHSSEIRGWCTRDWCTRGDAPEVIHESLMH